MGARGWKGLSGLLLAGALIAGCASSPEHDVPGSTSRTLSQAEVDALIAGEGMGMAAPAEINGYPGPAHVLELKEELGLSPDQRFATSRLVGLMRGQARALGQRIVDAERRLDADLADGNITGAQVRARLDTIGALRAQLRYTHIDAHLEQKKILTAEQVARYYELRGRVVVREPMLPPEATAPLTLPVEAPAAMPVEDVSPVAMPVPAVEPALPMTPGMLPASSAPAEEPKPLPSSIEEPAQTVTPVEEPALPAENVEPAPMPVEETPALPIEEQAPAEVPAISPGAQDAMEDAEPAREQLAYPLTPVEETPADPPAPLLEESPVEEEAPVEIPATSPGAQDAMEDAEPASEQPAYPLTPVEETPVQPPSLLLEESPVEEEAPVEIPATSPGAQDAMEDAEPASEQPAYPLTPVEETPAPPATLPEETPLEEALPADEVSTMSPGMQDAMEFAEPDSAAEDPAADAPVHIAPLEDELQELEPTDPREPVTIDLDN